jgi:hypothetical protein
MSLPDIINTCLDRMAWPEVRIFHRPRSAFRVCGYTGLVLAVLLAMTLVVHRGLAPWVMAAVVLVAVLTFFGLALITKIVVGEERLVYYHHEIAVMVMAAILLGLLRRPMLAYLDATILGIGLFLTFGRVGCLTVGCCHGRPCRWGVRYREEHAAAGLAHYYVGVRLFPIQAVESLWVFGTVVAGSALVVRGHPPGEALAWYVVTYNLGRFCFEFARGDPDRPYFGGFSEAQWWSLLLTGVVVGAELAGDLPYHPWHAGVAAGLVLAMATVTLARRLRGAVAHRLLHPHHVREVADVLECLAGPAAEKAPPATAVALGSEVPMGRTSLGVLLSQGAIHEPSGPVHLYAFSYQDGSMTEEVARTLAGLVLQLRHPSCRSELLTGSRGVFHLLVRPPAAAGPLPEPAAEGRTPLVGASGARAGIGMGKEAAV